MQKPTRSKFDTDEIKSKIKLSELIGKDTELKKQTPDIFLGLCPFHQESTPSLDVNDKKGLYYCFGCGAHGDAIDYIVQSRGKSFVDACKMLSGEELKLTKLPKRAIVVKEPKDSLYQIFPVPETVPEITGDFEAYNPKRDTTIRQKATLIHPYKNKDGKLLGYIVRVDSIAAGKIFFPLTWCRKEDESEGWCVKAFPTPRPLYRLETIQANDKQVIICEGEKAADACFQLLGCNVVSWSGGAKSVRQTDWKPLAGRKVAIWADADQVGAEAAEEIKQELFKIGVEQIKITFAPQDTPKGFDAADCLEQNWTKEMVQSWLRKFCVEVEKKEFKIAAESGDIFDMQDEFVVLGYNNGNYFYLPRRGQQVISLAAGSHTKLNLFQLASIGWWEEKFAHLGEKDKVNWDLVGSALMDKCTRKGIFSEAKMRRGRGAWIDGNKKILHLGDTVVIDGKEFQPGKTETKCVYEGAYPLSFDPTIKALSDEEAQKFYKICNEFSWVNTLSGKILPGWCVIAPICGMLDWRPHIFVTGPSGVGKSTINTMVIKPMLGEFGMFIEGKTTEAGIRQTLKRDALPVVFDEAEAEDKASAIRMQAILDLARVASSGGEMIKGTAGGDSMSYCIRSSFCFFAINPSISQYADESRITKLVLKKSFEFGSAEKYNKLVVEINDTITPDYAAAMMKRAFDNIETLLVNIKTFNRAAREIFTEKRQADQIAPMLAGTYLCVSTKRLTLDEAKQWIAGEDWLEHSRELVRDEDRLLNTLLTTTVKYDNGQVIRETSIGELIIICHNNNAWRKDEGAKTELRRWGMDIDEDFLWVANQSIPLGKLLAGTPWAGSWGQQLKNIVGAEPAPNKTYAAGINSRGTKIPLTYILGQTNDKEETSETVSTEDDIGHEIDIAKL